MKKGIESKAMYRTLAVGVLVAIWTVPAHASSSGGPFANTELFRFLDQFIEFITGPVAVGAGVIAMAIAGIAWAFTRHSKGGDMAIRALIGTGVATAASIIMSAIFGSSALM